MNGPEHYREAERILREVKHVEPDDINMASMIAEAQVHASLAQTAATVEASMMGASDQVQRLVYDDWFGHAPIDSRED